jgi:hypothetical protein
MLNAMGHNVKQNKLDFIMFAESDVEMKFHFRTGDFGDPVMHDIYRVLLSLEGQKWV